MADVSHNRDAAARAQAGKSADAFRTISEVAAQLDVPQHVLRFWESKFTQIRPLKRAGGRRYYRPEDILLLERIRGLLHRDGYTIRGVQRLLRERGIKGFMESDPTEAQAGAAFGAGAANGAPRQRGTGKDQNVAGTPTLDPATHRRLRAVLTELEELRALLTPPKP